MFVYSHSYSYLHRQTHSRTHAYSGEGWVGRGELRIAEVKSRILVLDEFVDMLEQLGFELLTKVHSTDQKLRSTSCDFV